MPLAGLAVAVVASAADGRNPDSPHPAAAIYIDRRANQEQVDALAAIVTERFGNRVSGPFAPPKLASVRVERGAESNQLIVDGVADLRGRPIIGEYKHPVSLQHGPGMTFSFLFVGRGAGGQVADAQTDVRFDGDGRGLLYGKFDLSAGGPPRRSR